jgi:hypothetical protein
MPRSKLSSQRGESFGSHKLKDLQTFIIIIIIIIIIITYLTASGCRPVAVVIMHMHKYQIRI